MRIAIPIVALLVLTVSSVTASGPHLRGASPRETRLIQELLARSSTARDLAGQIESSDVIAYVQLASELPGGRAATRFVVTTAGNRFLRVVLGAMTNPADRAALLAHELQHVVEIAHAPDVRDEKGLRQLYARIGEDRTARFVFETTAAREVAARVQREIARGEPGCGLSGLQNRETTLVSCEAP